MDIPETRLMLEQVRHYDHRQIIDPMVTDWQHALIRIPVEAAFDAIHDHFERCNSAHSVLLTAGEVLHHTRQNRDRKELEERKQRDLERNEAVFGSLHDHRNATEYELSLEAMHAGRAHLERILELRKAAAPSHQETK